MLWPSAPSGEVEAACVHGQPHAGVGVVRRAERPARFDAADGRDDAGEHRDGEGAVQWAPAGGATRATIRRSSPTRSTLWNASRVRPSRLVGAARSNIAAASLPSRLGAR